MNIMRTLIPEAGAGYHLLLSDFSSGKYDLKIREVCRGRSLDKRICKERRGCNIASSLFSVGKKKHSAIINMTYRCHVSFDKIYTERERNEDR